MFRLVHTLVKKNRAEDTTYQGPTPPPEELRLGLMFHNDVVENESLWSPWTGVSDSSEMWNPWDSDGPLPLLGDADWTSSQSYDSSTWSADEAYTRATSSQSNWSVWTPWDSEWSSATSEIDSFWSTDTDPTSDDDNTWTGFDDWTFETWTGWESETDWNMWSEWAPWTTYELINIDNYWTDNEDLNWCREDWKPDVTTEIELLDFVEDFVNSGNITNWCIAPGQVLVLTDLRNRDLNDPNGLPDIFRSKYAAIVCTKAICQRKLEQRANFDAGKLVNFVWRLMDAFKATGCKSCFCKSTELQELEMVLAITKDYLRKHVVLAYNTTAETPQDVANYYEDIKLGAGLAGVAFDPEKRYKTLYDMEDAVNGPGRASLNIQAHSELTHGILLFCK